VWKRSKVLLQLVWRPARRNKMNFVEIESPVCGSCHRQVPGMNGIKRASEQRDAARMVFYGGALRLRGGQCVSQDPISSIFSQIPEPRGRCITRIFVSGTLLQIRCLLRSRLGNLVECIRNRPDQFPHAFSRRR
jgi:hypothetical protein